MRGNCKKITGMFIIIVVCSIVSQSSAVEFAGGTGEPNDPYQIATAQQLISIGDDPILLEKHYVLVNDIDLDPNLPGGKVFTEAVIAPYEMYRQITPFSGSLDGNGHSISNILMVTNSNNNSESYFGFIGYLTFGAVVEDIHLQNISIRGVGERAGALAGYNGGMILRCSATGNITGKYSAGGLVGINYGDIVSCSAFCNVQSIPGGSSAGGLVGGNSGCMFNCYAIGTVTGWEYVGGLAGTNSSYISNCYAMGNVTGSEFVGGLIGLNGGDISNCYVTGTVTGKKYVGGLIGYLFFYFYWNTVSQCYAACEVIADPNDSIGGLIGESEEQITDSFWDIQVSGQKISAGGTGLTTVKLQDSETFLDAGWDMASETSNGVADIWTITEPNTYPQLTRFTDQYTVTQLSGRGTLDDPYEIATAEELAAINDYDINAHYVLVTDIDMSGMVLTTAPISFFNGTFDGRGHIISNLNIEGGSYLGLFNKIMTNGVVTNLTIQDASIIGYGHVGALAGVSFGHITNCHVTGNITGISYVSGLVGLVYIPYHTAFEDYVFNCTTDVVLLGNDHVDNIANVQFFD